VLLDNRYLSRIGEDALAQPLVPRLRSQTHGFQVDATENPRFFVNLLDATRARLLERARTSPREFFAPLALRPGLHVLTLAAVRGLFFAPGLRLFLRESWLAWILVRP